MFTNQSVAITGAGGAIGLGLAEMFIAHGAKVAISDLVAPVDDAQRIGAVPLACDVTDEQAVANFIADAEQANGPLDVYVSNAGVGFSDFPVGHAAGADNDAWETSWQVNVMSSVYAARVLLPRWIERRSGRFIITASAAGLLNQIASASYSATKHAAVGFAEALAISHRDDGINVHCICPQYVRSNMTKGMKFAEESRDQLLEPSDVADALVQAVKDDQFLVLPHAVVQNYFASKAQDHTRWISAMAKLKAKFSPADVTIGKGN